MISQLQPRDTTGYPSIEPVTNTPRESVHDYLVDSAYHGWQSLKGAVSEKVRSTVYNDYNFDLPQLNLIADGLNNIEVGQKKGSDYHLEIQSGGRERDYVLHVPPGYDGCKPMPLVVVLHGLSQDANEIADLSKMSQKADKEGFLVVYPNATKWMGSQSLQSWDVDNGVTPPGTDSNDVGFIKDLIGNVKKNLSVDGSRIYAAGYSNGGMLAYKLASEMSDTISAIAVVSGGSNGEERPPENAVSVISIHGTNDRWVPNAGLTGGSTLSGLGLPHFQSQKETFKSWMNKIGITNGESTRLAGDGVTEHRAVNERTGAEIVSYEVRAGKHEWPGSDRAKLDPRSPQANFSATNKIWDFFQSHSKASPLSFADK